MSRKKPGNWVRATVYVIVLLTIIGMVASMTSMALAAPGESGDDHPVFPNSAEVVGRRPPVVVLATWGLSWADIRSMAAESSAAASLPTASPASGGEATLGGAQALLAAAGEGEASNLVVRTAADRDCEADAWLTFAAGARTALPASGGGCAALDEAQASAASERYQADPAALREALATQGFSWAAVGPGARLALTGDATRTGSAFGRIAGSIKDLDLTDLPDLVLVDTAGGAGAQGSAADRAAALAVARQAFTGTGARIILASLGSEAGGPQMLLFPQGSTGLEGRSLLASASTHQAGFVQLTDLAPTILLALGGEVPPGMTGTALTLPLDGSQAAGSTQATQAATSLAAGEDRTEALTDLALRARTSKASTLPAGIALIAVSLILSAGTLLLLPRLHARATRRIRGLLLWAGALPLGVWLVPLVASWRIGAKGDTPAAWAPLLAVGVGSILALILAGTTVLALRTLSRRGGKVGPATAPAVLAALTAAVIILDGASGARLGFNGTLGMDAVLAGRFYGISNTAFAIAGAALLLAIAASVGARQPRRAEAWGRVVLAGLPFFILDAAPGLGSDVGGGITLVIALAALALWLGGDRISWKRGLAIVGAAAVIVGGLAVVDWASGSHTHLGRFVGDVLAGRAGATLTRKLAALVVPFLHYPAAAFALVALLALAGFVAHRVRRERQAWKAGHSPYQGIVRPAAWSVPCLKALAVLIVVEVGVNDSGATMALYSLATAAPLLLAAHLADGPWGRRAVPRED